MACSHKNIIKNGGFERTLKPWDTKRVSLVKNPVDKKTYSALMSGENSNLTQKVITKVESSCAYYLYFRLLNINKDSKLIANISYLDKNNRVLNSTPLTVKPSQKLQLKWAGYFSIVPPPPKNTHSIKVSFELSSGQLFLDYISLVSTNIIKEDKTKGQLLQIH